MCGSNITTTFRDPQRGHFSRLHSVVKSHPTPTPRFASKNDPSDGAETGGAEPQVVEQSRSWRAAIGEREIMRGF